MRIGIVGFGYVGEGMHRLFNGAHDVIWYDNNRPGGATQEQISACEIAFVCVPTPMAEDGSCDISAVEDTIAWCEAQTICIKSTVPPGTSDMLGGKYGRNLCFSPEYLGEGKQFVAPWKYADPRDARSHEFIIVGGENAHTVLDLYSTVLANDAHFLSCSNIEAELVKYMENAFLAVKVAFCYEYAMIANAFGCDYKRIRELWLNDARMGRSHTMVLPNQKGFKGKCLPKDISAIVEASMTQGFDPKLLRSVRDINKVRTT